MSIEALKQELAALSAKEQRELIAFLVSLLDDRDMVYRNKLTVRIDKPASEFATLDELDRRLSKS